MHEGRAVMRCCLPLGVVVVLVARLCGAQVADTATHRRAGAIVSGLVVDSVARTPLAGATVQLVSADSPARFALTAVTDALGRFTLNDVPNGRFNIGFFHPMLDSLGVEAPLGEVKVEGQGFVRADLAIPSPERLRAAICGEKSLRDSGAVVVGIVREARDGARAAGVTVTGEWLEFSFRKGKLIRNAPRLVVTTAENGWFAMCNVPSAGSMTLIASRGKDSTGLIELQIPPEKFLRHELYLAGEPATVTAVISDASQRTGNPPLPSNLARVSGGRLSGTVVSAALGGRPVVGAQVSVADGPEVRTNERGEWTLADVPLGTQMLQILALGYYPDRRHVHVISGAAPVNVQLSTLSAVLDTIRVRASRYRGQDLAGFYQRRETAAGRYLTAEQIARRPAIFTSDIFRTLTGVRLGHSADTVASDMVQRVSPDSTREFAKRILIHGIAGNWCAPAIYLEGVGMPGLTADDIDAWVRPGNIAAIEIYSEATVPPEFQSGRSGCGSVVIWTK